MTVLKKKGDGKKIRHVTLKMVAERVGLTKGTCSAVLNKSAASRSVPPHTQERILRAARELNYRPSFYARNLGVKRTYMIGVVTQEVGDFYGSPIISGIERYLRQKNFFYLTVAHRDDPKLLETYSHILLDRGVEGFITVDTFIDRPLPLPAIAIPGHRRVEGVTNMVLDHRKAAWLALNHLIGLGHKDIAFMKGSDESPDSEDRWKAIREVAKELGIGMRAELIVQLEGRDATPQLGYPFAVQLLARKRPFTALFAYNDISAIGSILAFQEAGLRVPEDISVVGFDDIRIAVHNNPSLTTVRQPLQMMGEIAARALLNRIEDHEDWVPEIAITPEFVVRNSTARAPALPVVRGDRGHSKDVLVRD
ncbi:MAG TPA: LacI family DNA-binding transcriptional regulator [Candidatus Sulfotelmatobacter sp.]|jgi:DNA-binding LacI/PurR family transcriptional regulator|nr:LacI family DNA-binding transcriptional regulator [Candidatus Sulfotelmatobacter sp.]